MHRLLYQDDQISSSELDCIFFRYHFGQQIIEHLIYSTINSSSAFDNITSVYMNLLVLLNPILNLTKLASWPSSSVSKYFNGLVKVMFSVLGLHIYIIKYVKPVESLQPAPNILSDVSGYVTCLSFCEDLELQTWSIYHGNNGCVNIKIRFDGCLDVPKGGGGGMTLNLYFTSTHSKCSSCGIKLYRCNDLAQSRFLLLQSGRCTICFRFYFSTFRI